MAKETIKPKNPKDIYELEDSDYLLVTAITNLTQEIQKLRGELHGR